MDTQIGAPGTAGEVDAAEFLAAFEGFAQAVRRARGAASPDVATRLTLSQYALLQPLAAVAGARVSDLAADAGIAPSTASRIIDGLERRAIVRRTPSPVDRRGVIVSLTDEGRELLNVQDGWMRRRQAEFFAGLPEAEQAVISDLLVRLAALIDDLSAGPGPAGD